MAKSRRLFQISLKAFLLLPLLVFVGLIFIRSQVKYRVASGTPGFKLAQLVASSDAHDQFESWLKTTGYVRCERPKLGSHHPEHRESWYFGEHDEIEHYIFVSSHDSALLAGVHFESEKWIFEDTRMKISETSATDEIAHKIQSWLKQNASLLTRRKQN